MARLHAVRRRRRRGRSSAGMLGLVVVAAGAVMLVLAFAAAGGGGAGAASGSTASAQASSAGAASALETYLAPLVAQDPKPFASLARADRDWMLKTAVWVAAEQDHYAYTSDDRQSVPADRVRSAYRTFFGSDAAPSFRTFASDGVEYVYHADTQRYDVPVTAKKDVYTPRVTAVRQDGNTLAVTVGYVPSTGWTQRADGSVVPPASVKTMRYTLRHDGTGYAVSAVENA